MHVTSCAAAASTLVRLQYHIALQVPRASMLQAMALIHVSGAPAAVCANAPHL